MLLRLLCFVSALFALAACAEAQPRGTVVLAPSSMQEAIEDIASAFSATGRPRPVVSIAGTPALARQVEEGAPADIFISADADWMDRLVEQGLVRMETRTDIVSNRLVLVQAPSVTGPLWLPPASLAAVVGDARIAVADPDAVPAGRYAKAALQRLGEWDALADRIVPTENVRAAAALAERGEVDYAIVYATDQIASPALGLTGTFPDDVTPPIAYPAAQLTASTGENAAAFLAFLGSKQARAILRRHGFGSPR